MSNVVSLATAREERSAHVCGTAKCLQCRHEWEAVAPVGTIDLECPECSLPRGIWKYNFGPMEGDQMLVCDCGNDALSAYLRHGKMCVKCMACGTDLTHAFYGD
tara:strand:- start:118 stop:429 length:312 start_codon:yes stop_codon:yes gene_type:complete